MNSNRILLDLATISSSEIVVLLSIYSFFLSFSGDMDGGLHYTRPLVCPITTVTSELYRVTRLSGFRKINRPLDRDYETGIYSLKAISFAHKNVAPILQEHWKECRTHSTRTLERTATSLEVNKSNKVRNKFENFWFSRWGVRAQNQHINESQSTKADENNPQRVSNHNFGNFFILSTSPTSHQKETLLCHNPPQINNVKIFNEPAPFVQPSSRTGGPPSKTTDNRGGTPNYMCHIQSTTESHQPYQINYIAAKEKNESDTEGFQKSTSTRIQITRLTKFKTKQPMPPRCSSLLRYRSVVY
ncbi:hypothetical protein CEXT_695871 [Caerostris extrusa]|uniref:Uncharacterized protein n=1 Tax=Caerostris extrusa TaxID=172846 RepID=A0AAV4ULJ9_CAEEX|nr:hypothetical protein CEXT_695871 [Caerostris extrusa]